MPTFEEIQQLVALAEERASQEVEIWVPEKPGDKIAGFVVELGSITTQFGEVFTTTIKTVSDYVENGEFKPGKEGKMIRVAWMGAVLKAQFQRMQPRPDDIVAFHYQNDITPKSGLEDYANIVAVVLDANTQKAKVPANVSVVVPTVDQIVNADPRTRELAMVDRTFEPFTEANETLPDKKKRSSQGTETEKTE